MMTDWPNCAPSLLPTTRAMMSVVPPTAYGTTRRMGLSGYSAAARPGVIRHASRTASGSFLMDVIVVSSG
ncbi:hypothetical protein D3C85_1883500 [compost metagenome]